MLLQWIRHHILVFEERKFPTSYEEIEVNGTRSLVVNSGNTFGYLWDNKDNKHNSIRNSIIFYNSIEGSLASVSEV